MSHQKPDRVLCPLCQEENRPDAKFCQYCGRDIVLNNDIPTPDNRRYYITDVIKVGGQGSVYEGVDQDGKVFAIKEMLDAFTTPQEKQEAIDRFNLEATILQRLHHPRIPRIYSHFTDEGRHYLTMDYVEGEDLQTIVEREGAIPEDQVLKWAYQICDVLHHIHQNNLVYRDMKPSNVMIEPDGNVKVVDFGIAKVFQPNKTGTQIGTPGYAPPEQYQGIATVQSDIYALGATLHHLLTGRDPTLHPPFSFEPARDINIKVSRRTSDVVDKALSFNSEDRFATVVEFRAAIRSLQGGDDEPLPDSPASTLTLPQMAQQPAPKQVSGSAQSLPSKKPKPPRKSTSSSSSSSSKSSRSSRSSRSSSSSSAPYIPPNAIPIQESELKRFWGCIWKVLLAILIILIFLCSLLMFIPTESIVVDEQTPISAPPTAVVLPTRTPAPSPTPRPAATPTPPPAPAQNLPTGFKTFEVEAELDANASDSEIKAALKEAYLQRVEQEYQGAVQANPNMISFVGEWSTTGGGTAGTVTYHSKVQGFLSPSSP